jgi:Fe-S oxidoreductase
VSPAVGPVFAAAALAATAIGWTLLVYRVAVFARHFAAGQPELPGGRRDRPWRRTGATAAQVFGHRQMARRPFIAAAHWLTMMSFFVLVTTLIAATGQVFDPHFELPLLGRWVPYAWTVEALAWLGLAGIGALIAVRGAASRRSLGRRSRFFGSHQWRARYVEATILAVVVLVLWLRGVESQLPGAPGAALFPTTAWIGRVHAGAAPEALEWWVRSLALAKLLVSYAWMVVVGLTPTMGVAWHRFLAFATLWTAKRPDASPALGGLDGVVVDGRAIDFADPDLPETVFERLGVGASTDLTWRDRLAVTTCTECGRCQAVCPAWATDKPLSPKALVGALRDQVWAERQAHDADRPPLVGPSAPDAISQEALWACTTCGACVDICPVGIEHVDHVIDLRRRQVLGLAEFPAELDGVFRNLERRKNPWGMLPKKRLDWAAPLSFDVPVLGVDVASLGEVDYLYWVGCAGAFDERGAATARAFATLLHQAGVSFAVLGSAECCTGDPARRAGNEPVFAELAAANVATLNAAGATKIVVTCAHCLNSLGSEYGPFGGRYQVLHHTELLAELIAAGRLRPGDLPCDAVGGGVGAGAARGADGGAPAGVETGAGPVVVTYQDPCYLSRHGGVTSAPRAVLGAIGNLELREMRCHGRDSGCCGAGGARMWLEETQGTRINARRFGEATATGASAVATACPFCSTMMGDAAAAEASSVAVQDVAQLLLAAAGDRTASCNYVGTARGR